MFFLASYPHIPKSKRGSKTFLPSIRFLVMSNIKKKPWNRLNLPVYSVASYSGQQHNMNICTYVTQVSMQPKRFVVAVYKGTKTLDNVTASRQFILQILGAQHVTLVNRFSKFSGHKKDKLKPIAKLLSHYKGFKILTDAIAVIGLEVIDLTDGGDHMLALCNVTGYKNITEGEVLTLNHLREKGLISI